MTGQREKIWTFAHQSQKLNRSSQSVLISCKLHFHDTMDTTQLSLGGCGVNGRLVLLQMETIFDIVGLFFW